MFAIAAPLACILQYYSIAKYWDTSVQGKCVDAGAYTVSTSSIVLTTDVLILLMPSWMLHDVKMLPGRKLMVIAFLSFGVLVTAVGAVRTSVLVKVFIQKRVTADPIYGINYILSNIESGLAITGTRGATIKYILSCCIPWLKVADELSNRGYRYPTCGSQGDSRSKRFTKGTGTHGTLKDYDEIELTRISANGKKAGSRDTQHQNPMMITKTVAWRVDNAQEKDSNSTSGEHTSRDILKRTG